MISYILSKIISMCLGLLYPAYSSYKAVKNKNVKEYVHWMMYWIVFSLFSFFEVFVDTFIGCWFPFYYELKIIFIIWMLSPTTRGGSVLYRRIIHPMFTRHENEIDAYLADFKLHASNLVVRWGTSAFNYITEMVMNAILRAGAGEHPFFKQKRSFSIDGFDEHDMVTRNNQLQHADNSALFSDSETSPGPEDPRQRQWRPNDRYGSVEREMNLYNELSGPYTIRHMDDIVGMDADDNTVVHAPPPKTKTRSSSRKTKEFGNFSVVTSQDMAMPLVFGWYPPPNVVPDMNTASSIYIQPSMYPPFLTPQSVENPVEVANREQTEAFFSRPRSHQHLDESKEDDIMESETDNDFFDCEMETDDKKPDQNEEVANSPSSSVQPSVKHVSKTNLQTFDSESKPSTPLPRRRTARSNERDLKRNSMSSLQSKAGVAPKAGASDKSKVKKSLSNSDLKLVKPASIWSTSSFRRVLSPFSSSSSSSPPKASSATNLKRSGSTASRASLNFEKKRKSESRDEQ